MPGLFALCSRVLHNPQMATFAAFGSFATLVLAAFGGSRRDKAMAHLGLALVGSALVVIGTAVCTSTPLAAGAALVVAFCVLFAGVTGPNAASGATAAMLAFVLPAASPGTLSMLPDRLAGWWLASAVGTLAVLTLAPRRAADRLRAAAAELATALATLLDAALAGAAQARERDEVTAARKSLLSAFTSAPYRPTGLAAPDQALAALVEDLHWGSTAVTEAVRDVADLLAAPEADRQLLSAAAAALRDTAGIIRGEDVAPRLDELESRQRACALKAASVFGVVSAGTDGMGTDGAGTDGAGTEGAGTDGAGTEGAGTDGLPERLLVHVAFHSYIVGAAARRAVSDAMVTAKAWHARLSAAPGHASMLSTEDAMLSTKDDSGGGPCGPAGVVSAATNLLVRHTSLRSVWFLNSARGAFALAVAVAIAKLTNVQHGFWVVLGTLSVLRTSAASTGATALRALGGTAVGFFIGAGLILALGSHPVALWVALPVAVLIAAYSPGTTPFAVGQAAFTVTLSVLYNIIVPVGWKVGALRLEDVAIGAAVSAVAGLLFWPRGAARVVGDDLADAFHRGGVYLVQATSWALGSRTSAPDSAAAASEAAVRLEDALRGLLAEQGTKHVPRDQLWRLVGGAMRVRLSAQSLIATAAPGMMPEGVHLALVQEAVRVAGGCDRLASELGRTSSTVAQELAALPPADLSVAARYGYGLWVLEHLEHVRHNLAGLGGIAAAVAESWARPWWG